MGRLVIVRHGQSTYNALNLFTGWSDVPLTSKGEEEMKEAGNILLKEGFVSFDACWTSYLKRAIESAEILLQELSLTSLGIQKDWRFNERHYGALEGLNKAEAVDTFSYKTVYSWRRTYEGRPPLLKEDDPRNPKFSDLYQGVDPSLLPRGESLRDTRVRVEEAYKEDLVPLLKEGKTVLLVAHANSLRALCMVLEKIPEEKMDGVYIPTGIPCVYEFDRDLSLLSKRYLGNGEDVEKKIKDSLSYSWNHR